jgi:hypothetical protein
MVEPLTSDLTTIETASVHEPLKPRVILNFVAPVLTSIESTRVPEHVMVEPLTSRILNPQQNRKYVVPHLTFLEPEIVTERTLSTQIPEDTLTNSITAQFVELSLTHPTLIASESPTTLEHVSPEPVSEMNTYRMLFLNGVK